MSKVSKVLIPTIYLGVIGVMVISVILVISGVKSYLYEPSVSQWTIDGVFDKNTTPVSKTTTNVETIIKPYITDTVSVGKYFYDFESKDEKKQQESLIVYGGTYMQNNGVDYVDQESFEVVSILPGEVMSIEDNDVYGKVITIKHNENLTSVYSNVKDVLVSVGYWASQGEIIAKADTSKLDNKEESMLHFEVHYKNSPLDPESLYTLSVSELQ